MYAMVFLIYTQCIFNSQSFQKNFESILKKKKVKYCLCVKVVISRNIKFLLVKAFFTKE